MLVFWIQWKYAVFRSPTLRSGSGMWRHEA
jgi:hypothetical protein